MKRKFCHDLALFWKLSGASALQRMLTELEEKQPSHFILTLVPCSTYMLSFKKSIILKHIFIECQITHLERKGSELQ